MKSFLLVAFIVLVKGYLKVFNPASLHSKFAVKYPEGHIPVSIGNFGNPPYGQSLTGQLIIEQGPNSKACSPLPYIDESHSISSSILLIDRGDCAFVSKVRNAQSIGARAVVIINNQDGDIESFIMTDNGSAGNLDIPALLISKEDGTALKDYSAGSRYTDVTLTITFDMNKIKRKDLELVIYMQSTSEPILELLVQLGPYLKFFPNLKFTPHYFIFECKSCKDSGFRSIKSECISGGRYCAYDSDGSGKLEGKDAVVEDLRQICVFKVTGKEYGKWFQYIRLFYQQCITTLDVKCVRKVLSQAGISYDKVKECMENSIEGHDLYLNDNKLMREESRWYQLEEIPFNPAIIINNLMYRGDLEAEVVVQAMCASYYADMQPDYCKGKEEKSSRKVENKAFVWAIVLGITLVVVVTLVFYRLWIRKELKKDLKIQVGRAVSDYFQLAEINAK